MEQPTARAVRCRICGNDGFEFSNVGDVSVETTPGDPPQSDATVCLRCLTCGAVVVFAGKYGDSQWRRG